MTTVTLPRTSVSRLRRIVVAVIVVAFTLAAAGGIVVLLGGDLGETAGRVIGTTATVGAFSVAVLCCAALLGPCWRRSAWRASSSRSSRAPS